MTPSGVTDIANHPTTRNHSQRCKEKPTCKESLSPSLNAITSQKCMEQKETWALLSFSFLLLQHLSKQTWLMFQGWHIPVLLMTTCPLLLSPVFDPFWYMHFKSEQTEQMTAWKLCWSLVRTMNLVFSGKHGLGNIVSSTQESTSQLKTVITPTHFTQNKKYLCQVL